MVPLIIDQEPLCPAETLSEAREEYRAVHFASSRVGPGSL
jgi:hypothetical protein